MVSTYLFVFDFKASTRNLFRMFVMLTKDPIRPIAANDLRPNTKITGQYINWVIKHGVSQGWTVGAVIY